MGEHQSALGPAPRWLDVQLIADDGSPVATGEPGELLVRRKGDAPRRGFFSEYYKDKQATDDAWADGWFHTGDIVREGDDGNVFFVDRKKNVIRRSGENIAAVDVESVLRRHPDVVDVGVTSVSDEVRGDEVFACLVVDSPSPELADAIVTWSLRQMAYYKVPGFITFVAELPLTATQKVQRAALRELAQTLLRDPETIDIRHRKKRQTHVGQSS